MAGYLRLLPLRTNIPACNERCSIGHYMRPLERGTYGGIPPGCAASVGACGAGADVAMKLCSEDMLPGVCGGVVVGAARHGSLSAARGPSPSAKHSMLAPCRLLCCTLRCTLHPSSLHRTPTSKPLTVAFFARSSLYMSANMSA